MNVRVSCRDGSYHNYVGVVVDTTGSFLILWDVLQAGKKYKILIPESAITKVEIEYET